jgi:hypothetical protein
MGKCLYERSRRMLKSTPLSLVRVLVTLLVALLAGLAIVSLSSTNGADAQEATNDEAAAKADVNKKVNSANGKGQQHNPEADFTTKFEFKVRNLDRTSDEATGKVSFENSQGSERQSGEGLIECFTVDKYFGGTKIGYFVFRITESSGTDAPPVGTPIGVNILDTGKKHGKGDGLRGTPVGAPEDPTPPCLPPSGEVDPLTNGDINIDIVRLQPA